MKQGIRNLLPSPSRNPAKRGSRDPHQFSCVLVVQTQVIGKPQSFQFVHLKGDMLKLPQGDPPWFEKVDPWIDRNSAFLSRSHHSSCPF
jgi:hypothetical protein